MKEEKTARRFALVNCDGSPPANLNEAKEALDVLRNARREITLPKLGVKPSLGDYIDSYFGKAEVARKKPTTLAREAGCLGEWKRHLGDVRIDRITRAMVASFRNKRLRVQDPRAHSGRWAS